MNRTFERYCQRKELSAFLIEAGYDPSNYDLDSLIEEGWGERIKTGAKTYEFL